MSEIYGYVRISTSFQKSDRQIDELRKYAKKEKFKYKKIYQDVISGKNYDRPELNQLRETICSGDVVVITELDRLGRRYVDTLEELEFFRKKKVKVIFLDLPELSTGDKIMDEFLNDVVLKVVAYMADKERERLKRRVREGYEAARKRGVRIGRPESPLSKAFLKYYDEWKAGKYKAVEVYKILGVSKGTFYNWVKIHEGRYKRTG